MDLGDTIHSLIGKWLYFPSSPRFYSLGGSVTNNILTGRWSVVQDLKTRSSEGQLEELEKFNLEGGDF